MSQIKELYKKLILRPMYGADEKKNLAGSDKTCIVCSSNFSSFTKYQGGYDAVPEWHKKIQPVGSDLDNFGCPACGCSDRLRHLYLYFDKTGFWNKFNQAAVLHFAPEPRLRAKLKESNLSKYVMADLYPGDEEITKVDIIDIPFEPNTFDIVICNHVLEHIPDYKKAMSEILRVLKPGGQAILQTPYSKLLQTNFEDDGINTEELRLLYYGQDDHVRYFSERVFFESLSQTGFEMKVVEHDDVFGPEVASKFGVNALEPLILVGKPS